MKKVYILIFILIIETLFIFYYVPKTNAKVDDLEKENLHLRNDNNSLSFENERLSMMNSEIWELFLADRKVKEE